MKWYNFLYNLICKRYGHIPMRVTDFTIIDPYSEKDDREEFDSFYICKRCLRHVNDPGNSRFSKWAKA